MGPQAARKAPFGVILKIKNKFMPGATFVFRRSNAALQEADAALGMKIGVGTVQKSPKTRPRASSSVGSLSLLRAHSRESQTALASPRSLLINFLFHVLASTSITPNGAGHWGFYGPRL